MTAATPPPQEDGPEHPQADRGAAPDRDPAAEHDPAPAHGAGPEHDAAAEPGTAVEHEAAVEHETTLEHEAALEHEATPEGPAARDDDAAPGHDVEPEFVTVPYPAYYAPTTVDVTGGARGPRTGADRLWVKGVVGVATAGVITLLGFPLGWLWSALAPGLPVVINDQRQLLLNDVEGEQRAAAEGTYILLTVGAGMVLAILAWILLRRFRGLPVAVALAVGGAGMGWLAWRFGHTIGLSHALALARTAPVGTVFTIPPDLRIKQPGAVAWWHGAIPYITGDLLYAGIAALLVYLLCVGFSASPTLLPRKIAPPDAGVELPPGTKDTPGGVY